LTISRPNRGQCGSALLEWILASAIGLVLGIACLLLFIQQLQFLKATLLRHRQAQDIQAVMQVVRAELRVAGQRERSGESPDHDNLRVDAGSPQALHYLCDRCGSTDRSRQSSFRLLDGVLAHRSLGVAAHQALNDPKVWAPDAWRIEQGQTGDCSPWVRLQVSSPVEGSTIAQSHTLMVRPRNLGPWVCERQGLGTAHDHASSTPPQRSLR
jgi:type II secretory pathway component PulJ